MEQRCILDRLESFNVMVDAVAGSGKTTTILHIARRFSSSSILLLTYNAKLKMETRNKAKSLDMSNLEVHSFHSFCYKYYDRGCHTDAGINKVLGMMQPKLQRDFRYDAIILDEAQDITPLYFELVCRIFRDNRIGRSGASDRCIDKDKEADTWTKLCILGDRYQSIFDFNHADNRFIIYADKVFNFASIRDTAGVAWKRCRLSQSFRITRPMSDFVNECMLGESRIVSSKPDEDLPRYIICDVFGHAKSKSKRKRSRPYRELQHYLDIGYSPSDIFVIAPSVRSDRSPARKLANEISDDGIPIYVPISDEERLDDEVIRDKLIFSTFHQVKGLERKVVLVFNFDNSYFKYYKRDHDPHVCANELYVAVTRASERLTVFHHYQNDFLYFLNRAKLSDLCQVITDIPVEVSGGRGEDAAFPVSVTDLVRHVPETVIQQCLSHLQITNRRPAGSKIDIPVKSRQKYGCEMVCDITGTAIPAHLEYKITGRMSIYKPNLINRHFRSKECLLDRNKTNRLCENLSLANLGTDKLLEIANCWNAYTSGYNFKLNQIDRFDWLSMDNLVKCIGRLETLGISGDCKFERKVEASDHPELQNRKVTGFIDLQTGGRVYEFKCVDMLCNEHYLQLAIYMYLNEVTKFAHPSAFNRKKLVIQHTGVKGTKKVTVSPMPKGPRSERYFLYNILTDELNEVRCGLDELRSMMRHLICSKYFNRKKDDNQTFLKKANAVKAKYR